MNCRNIFDLIDLIQQRTAMFIPDKSINSLQTFLRGYETCMSVHAILEHDVPVFKHFHEWLVRYYNFEFTASGWAYAIQYNVTDQEPLQKFFELVQEFQKLQPHLITRVKLGLNHQPTGKRVVIGIDKRMPPPNEIQIVQYKHEQLFFLRHCYPTMYEHSSLFSSLKDAIKWVEEEFQVRPEEWI